MSYSAAPFLLVLSVAILGLNSCKTAPTGETDVTVLQPAEVPNESAEPVLLISLRRTPCFGKCPVDLTQIYSDGRVTYAGSQNVPRTGTFEGRLDRKAWDPIMDTAQKMGFWSLEDTYPSGGMKIMDLPSEVIQLRLGDTEKQVVNKRYANPDVAGEQAVVESLNSLGAMIIALLDQAALQQVGGGND
jgi:hypothetical protein